MTDNEQAGTPPAAEVGRPRSVARNALHLVVGQVATTALAVALSAILGRRLGAQDFGLYFLLLTMSTFAYVVVEWGQGLFVIREVARHPEDSGRLLGTSLALRALGAALVAVPTGLLAWALGYDARTCWLAVAFIGTSLPFFLAQGYGMVFRGWDRMNLDATVSVVNKVLALAVTVAALLLGMGIPGVMLAQGVAGVAAVALASRLYRRLGAPKLAASRETAAAVLRGGLPILLMMVTVSVQPYIDAVILSKLVPPAAVGWYGAARNIMGTLVAPAMILASAIYPGLSRVAHDFPAFRQEMRSALRPLLWLGALGGVGTWLFAEAAIGLVYGLTGFGPAADILKAFGPALFLLFVDVLLGHVVTAAGRAGGFAIAKALSVLVNTGLLFWLIPLFQRRWGNGGVGVVVAAALSELVVFAGLLLLMRRGTMHPAVAVDFARALAAAGATVLLFELLPRFHWLLGIPVCIAAYTAATLVLGLMRRSDLGHLKEMVRRGR